MVVRVKLDTTMGSMVRELIAPAAALKEKEPFEAVRLPSNFALEPLLPKQSAFQGCLLSNMACQISLLHSSVSLLPIGMLPIVPVMTRALTCASG